MNPFDFYRHIYEDSPIETATIEVVNATPVRIPIPGLPTAREVFVPHYSCRIVTDADNRPFDNVPWLNPYVNPSTGAGLYINPKPKTKVLIAYAKKGQPYILGWLTPTSIDGRYTGNREPMPEGSVGIRGDRGNKILLLDGGIIRIESTPTCRRTYTPLQNQIRDFCKNYFLTTSGGRLSWTESRDGQRLTAIRIEAFEKGGGQGKRVLMQLGSHTDGDPEPTTPQGKLFSFVVAEKTAIYFGPNGHIIIKNEHPPGGDANKIEIKNDGEFELKNVKLVRVDTETGAIEFQAGSGGQTKVRLEPDGDVSIESGTNITIKATGTVTLDAPTVRTTTQTLLGGGGLGVSRLMDQVIVFDPEEGALTGFIIQGSGLTSSA